MKVKANENEELDIPFQEVTAKIVSVEDVETMNFGKKVKVTLNNDELSDFQVFINNVSMTNLVEAFGDDDEKWIGESVDLKLEKDEKYKSDMIVIYPFTAD